MKKYFDADVWEPKNKCPSLCKTAAPVAEWNVADARVIHAKHATYRNASFSGTFLLAETAKLPESKNGWGKVEVYCLWFKHRLKTRGIKIAVELNTAKIDKNYTGKVVANIAK